jgi:hypothetical protein
MGDSYEGGLGAFGRRRAYMALEDMRDSVEYD